MSLPTRYLKVLLDTKNCTCPQSCHPHCEAGGQHHQEGSTVILSTSGAIAAALHISQDALGLDWTLWQAGHSLSGPVATITITMNQLTGGRWAGGRLTCCEENRMTGDKEGEERVKIPPGPHQGEPHLAGLGLSPKSLSNSWAVESVMTSWITVYSSCTVMVCKRLHFPTEMTPAWTVCSPPLRSEVQENEMQDFQLTNSLLP